MAIIKCKMCGGDIELAEDKTFGTCEFCGSTMTFPKVDDEQRAAAFNRGNHFRRIGEFDKALAVYERIVREDDTDAEAHWCCALCRFGIEYVEDPATYEYLPTCHRASFDSFLEDVDYLAAVEHSEGITKRQYQKDGAKIAEVQRGILATSQNAEPYDVFICYKESDENGERTRDSLMAQDIYYQLTEQGRKVFFARITLEDVVGAQYEPYIFAALNSAKVMIVVGTKPEYLNAVWVKNEWSRFLTMMKKDRHKLLLPCYKDMDPYDMPEQLSVLQSYDMGKIGFIQDLTRGISKVLDAEKKPEMVKETVVVQQPSATNTAPLLKRAFMFLEDGDWASADEYCEKVLDLDPECAEAYVGKLMAELKVRKQENLKDQAAPFDGNNCYQKAVRFANEELKATLTGYIEYINTRNENARLYGIYCKTKTAMMVAKTESAYLSVEKEFRSISHYKDAAVLADQCAEKAIEAAKKAKKDAYDALVARIDTTRTQRDFELLAREFGKFGDYGDAEKCAAICLERAEVTRKDAILASGKAQMSGVVITSYESAIKLFKSIPGWRDADERIDACQKKIEELEAKAEADRLERKRQAEIALQEAERRSRKNKKIAVIVAVIVCAIIAFIIVLNAVIIPNGKYNDAIGLMEAGKYAEAIAAFEAMNGYKDSQGKIAECETAIFDGKYNDAIALMESGKYVEAISAFEAMNGYKDSQDKITECKYNDAIALMEAGQYVNAIAAFQAINGYKDSQDKIAECETAAFGYKYNDAIALMEAGKYVDAIATFQAISGYKDSQDKITECKYNDAIARMDAGNIVKAYEALIALDGYKDSADKASSIYDRYKAEKLKVAKVGDYVFFGTYEQDNNKSNGKEDIEWLVLEVKGGKVLVISKYVLDGKEYNTSITAVTWETCTLRTWLNNDFIKSAFTANEKAMIPTVTISADKNPKYSTNPGNATQDKVFLLSTTEVNKYFRSDSARECKPTDYAVANGDLSPYGAFWWLRTPGSIRSDATFVEPDGNVYEGGFFVDNDFGVRPVLWIELSKLQADE